MPTNGILKDFLNFSKLGLSGTFSIKIEEENGSFEDFLASDNLKEGRDLATSSDGAYISLLSSILLSLSLYIHRPPGTCRSAL